MNESEPQNGARDGASKQAKTNLGYWRDVVFKPGYIRDGQRIESQNYAVHLRFHGKRLKWSLHTPNREAAAARAKEVYFDLIKMGWEAAVAKHRPDLTPKKRENVTVGEFLAELREKSGLKSKTLDGYAIAFRKIIADITGAHHGRGGGKEKRAAWKQKIEAVKLSTLSPAKVQKWKIDFEKRAGDDPVKRRTARISANSFMRRAKSLFVPATTKYLDIVLPQPTPFEGVGMFPRQSMKYRSSFNVRNLISKARKELAKEEPEQFKILLLAVMAGLRRNEIDKLLWDSVLLDRAIIRIEVTEFYSPKTEDSLGDIEIDKELVAILRGYRAKATGPFVVETEVAPRFNVSSWEHYRCTSIFEGLIKWLKENGVQTSHPLHALRKEFGSQIANEHGVYAASRLLRHSDIKTTADSYLDKKRRIVSGFGNLLSGSDEKIIELGSATSAAPQPRRKRK